MLDAFGYLIGIVVALWATLLIAFPEFFYLDGAAKKKRFKGNHWGTYKGCENQHADDDEPGVEVSVPARKDRIVAGSETYAKGRGISFRS